jgi:hypothetical protein
MHEVLAGIQFLCPSTSPCSVYVHAATACQAEHHTNFLRVGVLSVLQHESNQLRVQVQPHLM